jgi:TolB protein
MKGALIRLGALSILIGGALAFLRLTGSRITPGGKGAKRASDAILVYSWRRDEGPSDILAIDADTGAITNLTRSKEQEFDPVWSPDRHQIAFAGLKRPQDTWTDIYVMDPDGSHRRQLTRSTANRLLGSPTWSPDGRRIAFHSVQFDESAFNFLTPEIYVMDPRGKNQRKVAQGLAPSWSSDGQSLLFLKVYQGASPEEGIWRVNADGSDARQVVKATLTVSASATWSPDGKRIAFVGRKTQSSSAFFPMETFR